MQFRSSRIRLLISNLKIVTQYYAENISSPNTDCFSRRWPLTPMYPKHKLTNICILYTDPQLLLWMLDHSRDRTSLYYCRPPKKNLYYPLYIDTAASNIPQMKIKATSQWLIKQLIKQFARFMQRKPKKCWCLLRNLSFGLFDHKKISGLFQDFSKKISAKFQDFPGLSSTSRTFQVFPGLVGTMCSLKRDSGIGVFLWILRNF